MPSFLYKSLQHVFVLFWLLPLSICAQTPGYLGMHHYISGNIYAFPSLRDKSSTVNLVISVELQRVWTRNFSSGIYYNSYTTQFGYESKITQKSGRCRMDGWEVGLKARWHYFFSRGIIAPLGPFQELEVGYMGYNVFDRYGHFYNKPQDVQNQYVGNNQHFTIGLGIGEQRIIYKYITFQYGVYAKYVFRSINNEKLEPLVQEISLDRIRRFQAFQLNVGLGWLLF